MIDGSYLFYTIIIVLNSFNLVDIANVNWTLMLSCSFLSLFLTFTIITLRFMLSVCLSTGRSPEVA